MAMSSTWFAASLSPAAIAPSSAASAIRNRLKTFVRITCKASVFTVQGFNLLFDRPFLLHCAPPNISVRGDFSLSLVESPASEQKGPPGGVPSGHFRRYG